MAWRTSRVRLPPEREGRLLLLLHDGRRAAPARAWADAERADAAGQQVLVERLLSGGLRWWWPLQRLQQVVRLEEQTCTHVHRPWLSPQPARELQVDEQRHQ